MTTGNNQTNVEWKRVGFYSLPIRTWLQGKVPVTTWQDYCVLLNVETEERKRIEVKGPYYK